MLRNVFIRSRHTNGQAGGNRTARSERKSQFNIRVDKELLDRFRDYCGRHGLDAHGQMLIFMRRMVDAEYDFQEKLWDALRQEAE